MRRGDNIRYKYTYIGYKYTVYMDTRIRESVYSIILKSREISTNYEFALGKSISERMNKNIKKL